MLEDRLVAILKERGLFISFAESCTGGLCAARIINVSGASDIISASFVTYSEYAKINLVDCQRETIDKFGVVSTNVAVEMAMGASIKSKSDIGIGITGVAGPNGGNSITPVGTVCFGIFYLNKQYSFTKHFTGDRLTVRNASVDFIFSKLIEILQ